MEPSATQDDTKTTIQILKKTAVRLTDHKRGNDTYDDVINRHVDHYEKTGT